MEVESRRMIGLPGRRRSRALTRLLFAACAAGVSIYYLAPLAMPLPTALRSPVEPTPDIRDRTGKPLRSLVVDGRRAGAPVPYGELPEALVQATLCAEDKRFWRHGGIDFLATGRAMRDAAQHRRFVSGASTVTQQLVKISSPVSERTFGVKVREAMLARKVEMLWEKERILSEYLSRLDYGNLRIGAESAAWGYFDKPLGDLTLAECAFLAGLPQAPSRYNPYVFFDVAKRRQQWVLRQMHDAGVIDNAAWMRAISQRLDLKAPDRSFEAPHLVDLILDRLPAEERRGRIRATIDLMLQHAVEKIVRDEVAKLAQRNVRHAAAVVIENATGEVLALVGSPDFFGVENGQVNGVVAARSPGSALKPFTYLVALERGDSPGTIVGDVPVEYPAEGGLYRPVNYDRRFYGPVTYREALANSFNVSAVRVLERHGGPAELKGVLESCGVNTLERDAGDYGLGLTIGNAEVRLLELTNAYACLARLGEYLPCRFMTGKTPAEGRRLFDRASCYLVADMLSDNRARSRAFGFRSHLTLPFRVACKTGTSTAFRDNWTIGFTPEFTVGVWAGNFDNTPMRKVSGVTGAGPIFRKVFVELHDRFGTTWYEQPGEVVEASIDLRNGKRIENAETIPGAGSFVRRELFRKDRLPEVATEEDYDENGRARLAVEYAAWLGTPDNWLGNAGFVPSGGEEDAVAPPEIAFPSPGSIFFLDPDLPDGGSRLPLEARGGGAAGVRWESGSLSIEQEESGSGPVATATAVLKPGRHAISAVDPETGASREVWILVEEI